MFNHLVRPRVKAFLLGILLPVVLFWGCSPTQEADQTSAPDPVPPTAQVIKADPSVPLKLAKAIVDACPIVDPGDENARQLCADKLSKLTVLRDSMADDIRWGGQKEANNYVLKDNNLTVFNALVWRQMYLSTFMFAGEPTVEQQNNLTLIHLPVQFRNRLSVGAFPYPFWHSHKKWVSYQQAKEILLIMEDGKVKGAMRSVEKDTNRPLVERKWDGQWAWEENGKQEPAVVLYKSLFSDANPHVKTLDTAYRAFEKEMRPHSCLVCHSPSNAAEMNPLLLLNYPNQALTLRHETVQQIKQNLMPPPKGIADDNQRQKLVELAEAFAKVGDKALAYEGERTASAKAASKPLKNAT